MESKLLALRRVVDELSGVYGVVAVVLYGSHARGDFDEGSDIDLFVLFKSKDAMLKGYRGVVRILSRSDLFIQANLRGLDELRECDPYFLQTVFAEGKFLYRHPSLRLDLTDILRLKPHALVEYSMEGLPPAGKCKLIFALFGRRSAGYRYRGLVERVGGWKTGRSSFVVPMDSLLEVERALRSAGVGYRYRLIWATPSKPERATLP